MGNILAILALGVSYGLILFLLATGMTLTMGLLRVVNMSHGAIFMFAGYCGIWVYQLTGSWIVAVLAGAVVGAVLGLVLEVGFLRRLYSTPMNQVLLTIGFIHIFSNITQWIWGGFPADVPSPFPFLSGSVTLGSISVPNYRFGIIVFGVILAAAIWYLQDKTRIGAMVRAGMDNGEIAGTLGLNNRKIFTFVFVLGSCIAGLSSMIGGTLTGLNMNTSWNVLLNSIIVVVIGGAGSIPGALLGGILIGVVNAFGSVYFSELASFIIYLILIIVLVIRPQGLMGRKVDVNKASDDYANMKGVKSKRFHVDDLGTLTGTLKAKLNLYRIFPYAIALIAMIVIPFVGSKFVVGMFAKVLIYALFAMSLDIVMGYTGNRSFGHAAFFGMGGYTAGLLFEHFGINSFWIVVPAVIIACAILSAIIGYFTLRLSGTNFLLVTMAFGQLLSVIAQKWGKVTGGSDGISGISRPDFGFFTMKWTSTKVYVLILIIFVICYFLLHRIMHSSFGHTLKGVKGNEGRMRALGYNTWSLKYAGVIVAGVFAGIAGLLYAYEYKTVVPNMFALETSALPMLMVIMGGGATLWGPALGALVIEVVQSYAGQILPDRWPLILGALYVICVMFLPGGFAPHLQNFWDWVGSKFFAKDIAKAKVADDAEEVAK